MGPIVTDHQLTAAVLALLIGVVGASLVVCWPAVDRAVRRYRREEMHRPGDPWCLRHRGRVRPRQRGHVCLVCAQMDDHVWARLREEQAARLWEARRRTTGVRR